jgi:hypothetical protein
MNTRLWVFVAALIALPGCGSVVAKRPATPAAALSRESLEAEPVPEGERYFLLLFGSESEPKRAVRTHTWVTAVRVAADGTLESKTISWMPRTLVIRPFHFTVEPAINLDLAQTMDMVTGQDENVTLLGPYEIPPRVYRRLLVQKDFLESYVIGYQGFDLVGEAGLHGNGANCIHAVTDVDPRYGRAGYLLAGNGVKATRYIRKILIQRGSISPEDGQNHDWLLPRLGLEPATLRRE